MGEVRNIETGGGPHSVRVTNEFSSSTDVGGQAEPYRKNFTDKHLHPLTDMRPQRGS